MNTMRCPCWVSHTFCFWFWFRYNFAAREEEVAALQALGQKELAAWYAATIAPGAADRRKLAVHVAGALHLLFLP